MDLHIAFWVAFIPFALGIAYAALGNLEGRDFSTFSTYGTEAPALVAVEPE